MTILLAALLVASDPAVAAQQSAPAASVAAPKKAAPKKICKSLDGDTGTHLSRRVCKTEDEWYTYNQGSSMEDLGTKGARTR